MTVTDLDPRRQQVIAMFDYLWAKNDAAPILEIVEHLAALGLCEVDDAVRLYPNHPTRVVAGKIGKWLYDEGLLDGLGVSPSLVDERRTQMTSLLAAVDFEKMLMRDGA